jgi:putative polyketide hydroxylase
VVAKGAFSFAAQVADRYADGRAFLVGDAAQRMTPRGGMGMNTAIAEGHDLAWKLAWVLRGWATPALLDTYEAEWRPIGTRRTARSADAGPRPSGHESLAEDLNARLPHAWLPTANGHPHSTLDLLGPGLTLLTGPDATPWTAATAALAPPYPLDVHALDPSTAATLAIAPDGAVLVRPDAQILAHCQAPLIVEQLAVAVLGADLREPGPLQRPDDLATRDDRELGHAGMRTSTDASSGFTSTSGTGLSSK